MYDAKNPPHESADAGISGAKGIRKVVIVGRDEALWLTASVMRASFHRTPLEIVAIELPSVRHSIDVIPSLRHQQAFHELLGLREGPLMSATQATYSLGQRFANFAWSKAPFMHGYGTYGASLNRVRFLQYWVKARNQGLPVEYDNFSLNAIAANQGRFFKPDSETDGGSECDYAYHFSALAYCYVLKQVLLARGGVTHIEGQLERVQRDPENGDISTVHLSGGQAVGGDLFIDATGAESLLLGGAMETGFESWAHWFPFDRVLTASGPSIQPLPAFSQVLAFRSGWVGLSPLRNRTAIQQVYRSAEMNDQAALDNVGRVASMPLTPDTHIAALKVGRRRAAWVGNCVGIGEAAAVFDPIDNVGLQTILLGLSHLTSLVPLDRDMTQERNEYNLNITSGFERIRDYQICHYKLNQRVGEPVWDECRGMILPDALAYKIKLFQARGHLVEYDDEIFVDYDWYAMFIGHGLIPRAYDPLANETPDDDVIQHFQSILGFIKRNVAGMQPMAAHLTQNDNTPAS